MSYDRDRTRFSRRLVAPITSGVNTSTARTATSDGPDSENQESVGVDHVAFRLGSSRYAVLAPRVAEVTRVPALTRVPGMPVWLPGVGNWRGHVLPVLDLRPLLDLPQIALPTSARVVVLVVDDIEMGLLTEAVTGLVRVSDELPSVPPTVAAHVAALLVGLLPGGATGPVGVLDIEALIALSARLTGTRRVA